MNTKTVSSFKNNFFQPCSKTLQYLQKIEVWGYLFARFVVIAPYFQVKTYFCIVFTGCLKQKFHNAVLVGQSLYSHFYS